MLATKTRLLAVCLSGGVLLSACGGGSHHSSGSGTSTPVAGVEVSGTATAPAGAVAMLEPHPWLIAARNFIISPASAAISGLDPVEGATVELIRVDNQGVQVGDVLASTATSVSGDYTLTLPAGVDLSGDLVVRISGTGGIEMRAQVVQQDVDINPISEFVLEKFINQGVDLSSLETASVIKLSGKVDDFDLTAGADLSSMLNALEQQTGAFVDSQIAVIQSTPGDAATVAGNYRSIEVDLGLHDDDQQYGTGTLSVDGYISTFSLSDQGSGAIGVSITEEDSHESNQNFFSGNSSATLTYDTNVDTSGGTADGQIDSDGVLSLVGEFEEQIDGDYGWRFPPSGDRLQKALNSNIFFETAADAGVRYKTVDTNSDGIKDAIDPSAREGDEAFRSFFVAARQPAKVAVSDLSGDYGRVYIETYLATGNYYNVRVERNTLSFNGAGSFDASATQYADLERSANGIAYSESGDPAASGINFSVASDGSSLTSGGETEDALFSEDYGFIALHSATTVDDANPNDNLVSELGVGTTFVVKLPQAQLDISGREYRFFFMGVSLGADATALASSRFDSTLTVNSDGMSGTLSHKISAIEKASSTAEVVATDNASTAVNSDTSITLAANGAATLVVHDTDGTATLEGFFSADGSLGIFHSKYADTGADPSELGVVFLVQLPSGQ